MEILLFSFHDLKKREKSHKCEIMCVSKQIELSEKNLEIFHINLFCNKSYLSTFSKSENFPNSNELLSQISLATKNHIMQY